MRPLQIIGTDPIKSLNSLIPIFGIFGMLPGLRCFPQGDHRHSTKGWYDSDDMIDRDYMIYRYQMIYRDQSGSPSRWIVSRLAAESPTICPGHPGRPDRS